MGIPLLNSWTIVFTGLVLSACITLGQFNHKKPWPTYSLQNMPQTRFTCHDKILGGYYADPETQCQMFHVCVKVAGVGVQDFRFLCPNGTAFDQEAQICADWGDVDCEQAVLYYGSDNFDLYRLGSGFESKRAPLAEEEEATFHLQRAETGDIRRSKETRVDQKRPEVQSYIKKFDKYESTDRNTFYDGNAENRKSNYDQNNDFKRVSQKFEAPKKTTSSYYTTPRANDFHGNADSKQDGDDLFKGSHSSNFFSNRNGGREEDFNENLQPTTARTTTLNQFFNGNASPQSDEFRNFQKSPDATTKRPHRSRRPIQGNANSVTSSATDRTTTYPTTVQETSKATKRLTLQSSFNAGFTFGNDKSYRPTSSASTTPPPTTSITTQRTSSTAQKYQFGANDYQQNIQPTTYNPSGTFRYKTTTYKYDDINETALRGEKPGQNTFVNSQYENQNFEIFSRVSNRKSQNTERNIQKQQAKNTTLANRNEFTDLAKKKTPTGFQSPSGGPSGAQPAESGGPQSFVNLGPNVQPLDPGKLNSELRAINQTQQSGRGRVPPTRFNNRQQTEPQYYRTKSYETPAPFTAPQQQLQQQFDNFLKEPAHKDFSRLKPESRSGFPTNGDSQTSNLNSYRSRSDQRTGNGTATESLQQYQPASIPQKETTRTRAQQRPGPAANDNSSQRSEGRTRTTNANREPLPRPQAQQPPSQFESTYNAYSSFGRSKTDPRSGSVSGSDFTSTTIASILSATPSHRGRGHINYKANTQHQGRSLDNFVQSTTSGVKKFSTLVPKDQYQPTTFKPTSKKAFDQKPRKHAEPKSRGPPYASSTTAPQPSTVSDAFSTVDEHDGQYHPELYEVDYTRNNVAQTKKPFEFTTKPHTTANPPSTSNSPQPYFQLPQQNNFPPQKPLHPATPTDLSDEEELFKTAHSLNLGAASINKLRADTLKTVDKTPQQSSPNFGFDRPSYPTTKSVSPSTTTWRPPTSFLATTTTVARTPSPSAKPKPKPKSKSASSKRPPHADKDTSYDYAYYDSLSETPQEYPEYDVISEFRKTKNH